MKKYRKASLLDASTNLPAATPFGMTRARSMGVLSSGEVTQYRADGIALAFDPMQSG